MTVVRFAESADAPALTRLMAEGLSPFDVATELARSYARLWVVESAGGAREPLGFLLAWEVADEAHLIDLIVAPGARRQGLGRALVETLVAHARARDLRLILLEVRRSNSAARRLYTRFGFEEVGERTAYYPDGEDALLFNLTLRAC